MEKHIIQGGANQKMLKQKNKMKNLFNERGNNDEKNNKVFSQCINYIRSNSI